MDNENGIAYHMATDMRHQEAKNENKMMRKKKEEVEEKYNIERMTVETIEAYLSSLEMENNKMKELRETNEKINHDCRNL